jgi:hypothetical protein
MDMDAIADAIALENVRRVLDRVITSSPLKGTLACAVYWSIRNRD